MKRLLLILPLLAACQDETADACGAESYGNLIGAQLAAVSLPEDLNHRVIGPDDAVTTDEVPERLNIRVDGEGVITALDCG